MKSREWFDAQELKERILEMKKVFEWFCDEENATLFVGILFVLPVILAIVLDIMKAFR